jgi:excisionase family DNA binding protein
MDLWRSPGRRAVAGRDNELMTIEQLAEYLQRPVRTLYQWNYTGEGPRRIRIGRTVRYRRSDVEAWLNKRYATAADS